MWANAGPSVEPLSTHEKSHMSFNGLPMWAVYAAVSGTRTMPYRRGWRCHPREHSAESGCEGERPMEDDPMDERPWLPPPSSPRRHLGRWLVLGGAAIALALALGVGM